MPESAPKKAAEIQSTSTLLVFDFNVEKRKRDSAKTKKTPTREEFAQWSIYEKAAWLEQN